jgi:hypothetical protein
VQNLPSYQLAPSSPLWQQLAITVIWSLTYINLHALYIHWVRLRRWLLNNTCRETTFNLLCIPCTIFILQQFCTQNEIQYLSVGTPTLQRNSFFRSTSEQRSLTPSISVLPAKWPFSGLQQAELTQQATPTNSANCQPTNDRPDKPAEIRIKGGQGSIQKE